MRRGPLPKNIPKLLFLFPNVNAPYPLPLKTKFPPRSIFRRTLHPLAVSRTPAPHTHCLWDFFVFLCTSPLFPSFIPRRRPGPSVFFPVLCIQTFYLTPPSPNNLTHVSPLPVYDPSPFSNSYVSLFALLNRCPAMPIYFLWWPFFQVKTVVRFFRNYRAVGTKLPQFLHMEAGAPLLDPGPPPFECDD